jgi:hypothetical protein
MKRYIVDVLIGLHSAKKFVVDSLDVAEMMAEYFRDDVTDVVIREVEV